MSDHHDNDGVKYEFKHDTDNYTVVSLLVFSIAVVALVVALTLLWMRSAKQNMLDNDASTYEYTNYQGHLENVYHNKGAGQSDLTNDEKKYTQSGIEEAKASVIEEYSK